MDIFSYLLGKKSGGGGTDWTKLGYTEEPKYITDGVNYAQQIYSNWNKSITNADDMFKNNKKLLYFPDVDMSNCTSATSMFFGSLVQYIHLSNIGTNTTGCGLSKFCSSDATNNIPGLREIYLSGKTWNISYIFEYCSVLTKVDFSNLEITNTTNMRNAFSRCFNLSYIDISNFDFSNYSGNASNMFSNCGIFASVDNGAYAEGIPMIYVKDETAQNWVLTATNSHGSNWTTDNVVIKQ